MTDERETPYTLLPYVREGFQPNRTYDPSKSELTGRSAFTVRTLIQGRKRDGSGTETREPEVDIRMYGPGDVTGIDTRQVVRTVPRPDTTTFPPNYFPHVEFYRPDLPWMFSPESADDDGKLRPWLALVVVPTDADGVTVEPPGSRPNPVLKAPNAELPPVEETWAWTHVQTVGDVVGDVDADTREELFRADSEQTVSRSICPRNLSAGTRYVACVVPTFEPGRRAGLGKEPFESADDAAGESEPTIATAWPNPDADVVELPVYYRFEFVTGERGDFEAAIDRMVPRNLSKPSYEVGFQEFDLADPGPDVLRTPDTVVGRMGGALTTVGVDTIDWSERSDLYDVLTDPESVAGIDASADSPGSTLPIVGPPSYGQWPPLALDWPADPGDGHRLEWLAELNLTPRYRIAAGLGTEVVREHQERLMDDAWSQFENLDDDTGVKLDRRKLGSEVERGVENALASIDLGRKYRDLERVREAIRVQETLDRLHGDGVPVDPSPGGGAIDPDRPGLTFGRDVVESVLRNNGMSPGMEDVLDDIETETGPGVTPTTTPGNGRVRADELLRGDSGSVVSFANVLGETRTRRAMESGDLNRAIDPDDGPVQPDGGTDALPASVPQFGSLGRVDAVTRSGGILSRRASGNADMAAVRDGLFEGPAISPPSGRTDERTVPDWLRDDQGRRMTVEEALAYHDDETKAVPKAVLQLRALRDDARAIRSRLSAVAERLGPEGEDGVPAGQAAAAAVATDPPALERQAALLNDLVDAANHSVSKVIGADHPAVSPELSQEKAAGTFRRIREANRHLLAAVERIAAGAAAAGGRESQNRRETDGGSRSESPTAITHEDVGLAGAAADEVVSETEALAAYVPTDSRVSRTMQAMSGTLPEASSAVPKHLLYDGIPLSDQPGLPGMLSGSDWAVARTAIDQFGLDLSPDSLAGARTAMERDPMAAPGFDWPMFEPLKDLSTEHVLPGVGKVPNNTIGALQTNDKFIEAYMAGLSHEFARELLWREYPTDRRGTYFQTFWNYDGPGKDKPTHDVEKIHTWDGKLGSNAPGDTGVGNRVVLLLKGDLLQAFPNTRIHAIPAVVEKRPDADPSDPPEETWDRTPLLENEDFGALIAPGYQQGGKPTDSEFVTEGGTTHVKAKEPIVHGKLDENVTFLLFDLDVDVARGEPLSGSPDSPADVENLGWFFAFEEPVGEIRFGLDANDDHENEAVRTAIHPTGKKYLRTDVGGYPANVTIGKDGRERTADAGFDGTDPWQEGPGEETGWTGLSWGHLVNHGAIPEEKSDPAAMVEAEQSAVNAIRHVRVAGPDANAPGGANDGQPGDEAWRADGTTWGQNGAHMAQITWQHPVRACYHVDDLLPADAGVYQGKDPDGVDWVDGSQGGTQ